MSYLFAIALLVIALITIAIGTLAAADPEGRGGSIVLWLCGGGGLAVVIAVVWLLWQIWNDYLRGMPFFHF